MIVNDPVVLWKHCLDIIKDNVAETTYKTWFEPIVPMRYEDKALTIGVPSPFFYEFLEEKICGFATFRSIQSYRRRNPIDV